MTRALDRFRSTVAELNQFARWVTEARAAIHSDGDLSPEGRRKQEDELRQEAEQRFEQLRDDYTTAVGDISREARDAAMFVYDKPEHARTHPYSSRAGDTQQQLLDEMRLQRAWARAQRRLDAGEAIGSLADEAYEQSDLTTLRALRVEGSSVVRSLAATNPGGPDARQVEADLLDTIDTHVAAMVGGSDGDELRAGVELRRIAGDAQRILEGAVRALTGRDLIGVDRIRQGFATRNIADDSGAAAQ